MIEYAAECLLMAQMRTADCIAQGLLSGANRKTFASRVAVLRESTRGPGIGQFAVIQALAPARGVEPIPIDPSDVADMERRITAFASVPNGGMIATVGGIARHRAAIIATANTNHLPTTYPYRYYWGKTRPAE